MGLRMNALRIIVWLVLVLPIVALAMTIGYDVKINNHLSVPVKIEIAQYHSAGFDGTRPKQFTEDLKIRTRVISLQPGELKTVHYNSALGGFWLLWKTIDSSTAKSPGVLDLVEGDRVINIE